MKWMQWDVDAPDDPKIKALVRWGLTQGGIARAQGLYGAYNLLCCYIGRAGLKAAPGLGLREDGTPLPLLEMAGECLLASVDELLPFLNFCAQYGLIHPQWWTERRVVFLPSMLKRMDDYTRRQCGRTAEGVVDEYWRRGQTPAAPSTTPGAALHNDLPPAPLSHAVHESRAARPPVSPVASVAAPQDLLGPEHDAAVEDGEAVAGQPMPGDDDPATPERVVAAWNAIMTAPVPQVRRLTTERRRGILLRIKRYPRMGEWKTAFANLNTYAWMRGQGDRGYVVDIDLALKNDTHLAKWLERGPERQPPSPANRGSHDPEPGKYADVSGPATASAASAAR
ncbi:MAG: hypothetical protein AB7K63_18215 [Vicinamibacterales bacterium]